MREMDAPPREEPSLRWNLLLVLSYLAVLALIGTAWV